MAFNQIAYDQVALNRETAFRDAVLSQAEAKSMEIIAEAGKKRAKALEEAYQQCEQSDYDVLKRKMDAEKEKEFTVVAGQAKQELLRHREALVDGLFAEVEQRLEAFREGGDYAAWVEARAAKHRELGGALTVLVRSADLGLETGLQKVLPGCAVQADETIRLGGCKVSDGRVLFDELSLIHI